uniref:Jacalin-type lectin domain-containing protein n=1 Tax=Oryzias latipes TaxID=8090 RepID=A0A3P9HJ02_ORYLA
MPYVAPVTLVGGQGGGPCSFDGAQNGAVLKKLDVWAGPTQVRCIKVQMSDGNERMFGREGDNHYSFTFEDGEKFTSLTLWPNNAGNRLGGFKFTTSNNRNFEAFMTNGKPSVPAREVDVGSGICFGVQGRSGSEIDAFGHMLMWGTTGTEWRLWLRQVMYKTQIFNNKNTIVKRPRKTQTLTPQMIGHAKARTPSSYSSSVCSQGSATSPGEELVDTGSTNLLNGTPPATQIFESIKALLNPADTGLTLMRKNRMRTLETGYLSPEL